MSKQKRKELLEKSLALLSIVNYLGDSNCPTCGGHGCVDTGSEFGTTMDYCPDCYTATENTVTNIKKHETKKVD